MAMRITHMLVHVTDDGFWLMNYDNHVARDVDYDEFVDHFSVCEKCNPGGEMDAEDMPMARLDLLVPFEATEKEIMEQIGIALDKERQIKEALTEIFKMIL
jgi:hypothetical protein